MTFSSILPILLIILVPIIIILYMLKQKATDHTFSSIMLWREVYRNIEATKPWEKLKNNLLMYLQILTVIGLIFALMGPYLKSGGNSYSNVLIVIDSSGSMNYSYNKDKTRFDEEINRAIDYVNSLDDTASVTVVTVDKESKLLFSGITDKSEINNKINNIKVTELAGNLNNGISMIDSIVKQWESYEIVMFTDTAVELGEIEAKVVNLYSEGNNASLDYVSYGYEEDALVVLTKVTNYGNEALVSDINLYGDGTLLAVEPVIVASGDSAIVYFKSVNFEGKCLKAEINNTDSLMSDNYAYTVMGKQGITSVLIVSESNIFLEKAAGSLSNVEVYKTTDSNVVGDSTPFDIYIFDGIIPNDLPSSNIIFINSDSNQYVELDGNIEGSMLTFRNSDVTTYLEGFSFGVNSGKAMKIPEWGTSYLELDDKCIGYYGQVDGRKVATLGFDIHSTDLALKPEFPILMANLIGYMSNNELVVNDSILTGDNISFNSDINGGNIIVEDCLGNMETLDVNGVLSYGNTDYSGIYKATQIVGAELKESYVAVNFPVGEESNVIEADEIEGSTVGEDIKPSGGRELSTAIIICLLILLTIEWIVYVKQR